MEDRSLGGTVPSAFVRAPDRFARQPLCQYVKLIVRYLGMHPNTLRKLVDLGKVEAKVLVDESGRKTRTFALESLDRYIDSLERW